MLRCPPHRRALLSFGLCYVSQPTAPRARTRVFQQCYAAHPTAARCCHLAYATFPHTPPRAPVLGCFNNATLPTPPPRASVIWSMLRFPIHRPARPYWSVPTMLRCPPHRRALLSFGLCYVSPSTAPCARTGVFQQCYVAHPIAARFCHLVYAAFPHPPPRTPVLGCFNNATLSTPPPRASVIWSMLRFPIHRPARQERLDPTRRIPN